MSEWDLMTEIAKANNSGNDQYLATLILDNDFTGMNRAVTMLVSSFQLTKENVSSNIEAAKKLVGLDSPKALRESLRHSMLVELIQEIEQ